jgi:maltose O-acetyltransferase
MSARSLTSDAAPLTLAPREHPRERPRLAGWRRELLGRLRGHPSRRWLVRHGLRLGRDVYIDDFAAFDHGFLWLISIADEAVLSAGVRIVAHDGSTNHWTGYIRLGRVDIGRRAYIGAHAIVLPGVSIGDNAIVGAGSVVRHDVPPGVVVMGNPAVEVGTVDDFAAKHLSRLEQRPRYPRAGFSAYDYVTPENMLAMIEDLADGSGYVE